MIRLDPLYLLLLVELALVLAGGLAYALIRSRNHLTLYQGVLKELAAAKQANETLRMQAAKPAAAPPVQIVEEASSVRASAGDTFELDVLREKLRTVEEELKEKSHRMELLQTKFSDLEKEYMVLYQQQQSQQGNT